LENVSQLSKGLAITAVKSAQFLYLIPQLVKTETTRKLDSHLCSLTWPGCSRKD
jgi:hypothetical protein